METTKYWLTFWMVGGSAGELFDGWPSPPEDRVSTRLLKRVCIYPSEQTKFFVMQFVYFGFVAAMNPDRAGNENMPLTAVNTYVRSKGLGYKPVNGNDADDPSFPYINVHFDVFPLLEGIREDDLKSNDLAWLECWR